MKRSPSFFFFFLRWSLSLGLQVCATMLSSQTEYSYKLKHLEWTVFSSRVSLARRAKKLFLPASMGQQALVPAATWDSFLDAVGVKLTWGFINASGLQGNPRNLESHGAPPILLVGQGRSLPRNRINKGTGNKIGPLGAAAVPPRSEARALPAQLAA